MKDYSEQFVKIGARLAADHTKRKNLKDILRDAKPRVDCRLRTYEPHRNTEVVIQSRPYETQRGLLTMNHG